MSRTRTLSQAPIAAVILLLAACSPETEPAVQEAPAPTSWPSPASVLSWTAEEKLAGFPNYDRIFLTRSIPASELKLYKGNCDVIGRKSPYPRYKEELVTYGDKDTFALNLSKVVIELWSTPYLK